MSIFKRKRADDKIIFIEITFVKTSKFKLFITSQKTFAGTCAKKEKVEGTRADIQIKNIAGALAPTFRVSFFNFFLFFFSGTTIQFAADQWLRSRLMSRHVNFFLC